MWKTYVDEYIKLIIDKLKIKQIKNFRILDLWCWTWTFLYRLSDNNSTYWVDLSENNIEIAKNKDKNSIYSVWDITDFSIDNKLDIITCCFDTINHLPSKELWIKVFKQSFDNLKDTGIFIFDINTINKFSNINWKSLVNRVWEDCIIIETNAFWNKCDFKISIFSKQKWKSYNLDVETISEISFEEQEVKNMLLNYFSSIEIKNDNDERLYFICKK